LCRGVGAMIRQAAGRDRESGGSAVEGLLPGKRGRTLGESGGRGEEGGGCERRAAPTRGGTHPHHTARSAAACRPVDVCRLDPLQPRPAAHQLPAGPCATPTPPAPPALRRWRRRARVLQALICQMLGPGRHVWPTQVLFGGCRLTPAPQGMHWMPWQDPLLGFTARLAELPAAPRPPPARTSPLARALQFHVLPADGGLRAGHAARRARPTQLACMC